MNEFNEQFPEFLVEYRYAGQTWCLHLKAESREDAEARLYSIGVGNVLGEIHAVYPVTTPKWYVSLVCWWKTLIGR